MRKIGSVNSSSINTPNYSQQISKFDYDNSNSFRN
jgi:hypothetical protein